MLISRCLMFCLVNNKKRQAVKTLVVEARDTLTISASGKEKLTKSTSGRTHNTSIDSSIDLKSYIASAKKTNQELIENAEFGDDAKCAAACVFRRPRPVPEQKSSLTVQDIVRIFHLVHFIGNGNPYVAPAERLGKGGLNQKIARLECCEACNGRLHGCMRQRNYQDYRQRRLRYK